MKDRYKINKIKFHQIKKERKKYALFPKEKSNEKIKREVEENIAFNKYKKLKHQIFEKEKKEKDISEQEFINKYTIDFNYTNVMKILHKLLSTKKDKSENNPFNYDIKKGKLLIENLNRNIKFNRISEYLKKIVLHFKKIKSKLETGINDKKLFFSEEMAENIKNKIEVHRKKIYTRNFNTNTNNTFKSNSRLKSKVSNNSTFIRNSNIMNNNKKRDIIEISNYNENKTNMTNKSKLNNNLKLTSFNSFNRKQINLRKNKNKSSSLLCFNLFNSKEEKTKNDNNLNYELINNKKTRIDSYGRKFKPNLKMNYNINNKNLLSNSSNPTHYSSFSLKEKKGRFGKVNTIVPNDVLIEDYNTNGLMKKYYSNQYYIKNNYSHNLSNRPQSCINIKNQNKFNFNEISTSNKNFMRSFSSVKKKSYLKVKNKPIYTTNINDFINEYNRIKKNIRKLNKNYKEKHFSTYKEIDHILKVKEDMQMFLLKQKFFHSKFKPKPSKLIKHKNEFIKKMKDYLELLEERPRKYS